MPVRTAATAPGAAGGGRRPVPQSRPVAGIAVLLVVVTVSIVVTRIASVALVMTGLSHDLARFQARSAFSGVGYTTGEAEKLMNHPARRRIVMILMLAGNAGLVTALASMVIAVVQTDDASAALLRLGVLTVGLVVLYLLTRSARVEVVLRTLIHRALRRWTGLALHDYESLLDVTGDYNVVELEVGEQGWLADRSLEELQLPDEGVTVLAVRRRSGSFLGAPGGDVVLETGDVLVVYGHRSTLRELADRKGDVQGTEGRRRSVDRHRQSQQRDARQDRGRRRGAPEER